MRYDEVCSTTGGAAAAGDNSRSSIAPDEAARSVTISLICFLFIGVHYLCGRATQTTLRPVSEEDAAAIYCPWRQIMSRDLNISRLFESINLVKGLMIFTQPTTKQTVNRSTASLSFTHSLSHSNTHACAREAHDST